MRVLIMSDMEGVRGIVVWRKVLEKGSRHLFLGDVAIERMNQSR